MGLREEIEIWKIREAQISGDDIELAKGMLSDRITLWGLMAMANASDEQLTAIDDEITEIATRIDTLKKQNMEKCFMEELRKVKTYDRSIERLAPRWLNYILAKGDFSAQASMYNSKVYVNKKYSPLSDRVFAHEVIHLRQRDRLLIVECPKSTFFIKKIGYFLDNIQASTRFYIVYGVDYLIQLCKYRNLHKAYINIGYEKEAYAATR